MGGVDWPVVRYQAPENAEAAVKALQGKQVWLDGVLLGGDWKGAKAPPAGAKKPTGDFSSKKYDEDYRELTSRELFLSRGSGGGGGHSRSRDRRRRRDGKDDGGGGPELA